MGSPCSNMRRALRWCVCVILGCRLDAEQGGTRGVWVLRHACSVRGLSPRAVCGSYTDMRCRCLCVCLPPGAAAPPFLQGYLPRDLYQLDSCYGSEAELRELIDKCHEHNIKVIADIVVNHR